MYAPVLVCLHGVGGGPGDFASWPTALPGWTVVAPDLQALARDLADASMHDYAAAAAAALPIDGQAFVCGWSMGGLVALMLAGRRNLAGLVLIEPSLPAEVAGLRKDEPLTRGVFDPADRYGPREDGLVARPDSLLAASERRRGVPVGQVACPVLVIGGRDFGSSRAQPLAEQLDAVLMTFPDLGHVALLHNEAVLAAMATWLSDVRRNRTS